MQDNLDPGSLLAQLYDLARSGKGTMAVGVALMLLVWVLRSPKFPLLNKISWLSKPLGGYVLGFGLSMLLYVGSGMASGAALTVSMLANALGAAWLAAGGWEHLKDVLGWMNSKKPPVAPVVAATMLLCIFSLGADGACGSSPPRPIADVIDCTKQDQNQLLSLGSQCAEKIPDWTATEACVVAALPQVGWQVGGCVLSKLAQQYLTTKGVARDVAQTHDARHAFEDFRANYGHNATFHSEAGDL